MLGTLSLFKYQTEYYKSFITSKKSLYVIKLEAIYALYFRLKETQSGNIKFEREKKKKVRELKS